MDGGSLWPIDRRRTLLAGSYKEGAEVLWEGPGRLVCKQEGCGGGGGGGGTSASTAAMAEPAAKHEKPTGLPDEDVGALLAAQEASVLEWGPDVEDRRAACCCRGDQRACTSCTQAITSLVLRFITMRIMLSTPSSPPPPSAGLTCAPAPPASASVASTSQCRSWLSRAVLGPGDTLSAWGSPLWCAHDSTHARVMKRRAC